MDDRIRIILNDDDKKRVISFLENRVSNNEKEKEITKEIIYKLKETKTINIYWFNKYKELTQINLLENIKYKVHRRPF